MIEMIKDYLEIGWPIFPVGRNKAPLCRHGIKDATLDIEAVYLWMDEFPDMNIATITGNELLVVDIDGEEGERSLAKITDQWQNLPQTVEAKTGRGRHLYYRGWPGAKSSCSKVANNIDIRANGGSIILPPSMHVSGKRYEWVRSPFEHDLANPPLWLMRRNSYKKRRRKIQVPASVRMDDLLSEVAKAPRGTRNHTLNRVSYIFGKMVAGGKIDENRARSLLITAGLSAGLGPVETRRTVDSGFDSGIDS